MDNRLRVNDSAPSMVLSPRGARLRSLRSLRSWPSSLFSFHIFNPCSDLFLFSKQGCWHSRPPFPHACEFLIQKISSLINPFYRQPDRGATDPVYCARWWGSVACAVVTVLSCLTISWSAWNFNKKVFVHPLCIGVPGKSHFWLRNVLSKTI